MKKVHARRFMIPAAVLAEPDLMKLLLPVLRADMTAVETYEYEQGSPLPCPITVSGHAPRSIVVFAPTSTCDPIKTRPS